MKTLLTIIKKELKRFFTDRRTLIAIFMPGIALYLCYTVMGSVMQDKAAEMNTIKEGTVCVVNKPEGEFFDKILSIENCEIKYENTLTEEQALEKIQNKELDLYVKYDADFLTKMAAYDPTSGTKAPDVKIYYNSAKNESSILYSTYVMTLEAFESQIANKFDVNFNNPTSPVKYDLATDEDSTAMFLTMIGPFLLIIMLFSSSMGLCAESISGEKERGTIATLLATPAKRWQLALGKVIPLGIVCLLAGCASSLGAILSLPKLVGGEGISLAAYGVGGFVLLALVIIITSVLFASILSMVSTYAKSVKEATTLCFAPMGLVMGIGMFSMFSTGASTNWWAYLIPVYNSVQCLTQVFSLSINPLFFVISILSNAAFIALCIFAVSKMFNNEKIMFAK